MAGQLNQFVSGHSGGMFVLGGYAGTGKTFLTTEIIKGMARQGKQVLVTAPTHKAVKVLRGFTGDNDLGITFSTLHSALGMKEVITKDGEQTFVRDKFIPCKLEGCYYLIVDESSMLSDDLFGYVHEFVESARLKVIFVGDPLQIPPVGKEDAIPFSELQQSVYGMQVGELHKIVRQAEGNPIIALASEVRDHVFHQYSLKGRKDTVINGTGVRFYEGAVRDEITGLCNRLFTSEQFQEDPDFAKVVAWTNRTVDAYNGMIRKMIYRDQVVDGTLPRIMEGEMLIADSPIMEDGTNRIAFSTNSEMRVLEFNVKTENVNDGQFLLKYYDTCVIDIDGTRQYWVKIIHEDSLGVYKDILRMLKDLALSKTRGSWQATEAWKAFYEFQENFAQVKYNYAITAHKAQGSTYENAIVLEYDINMNANVRERNRIKYTAFTRPRKMLHVVL